MSSILVQGWAASFRVCVGVQGHIGTLNLKPTVFNRAECQTPRSRFGLLYTFIFGGGSWDTF